MGYLIRKTLYIGYIDSQLIFNISGMHVISNSLYFCFYHCICKFMFKVKYIYQLNVIC